MDNKTNHHFERHLNVISDGCKAVELLANNTLLSKQKMTDAMQKWAVSITHGSHTQRLRRASKVIQSNDTPHCYYDEKILATDPPPTQLIADENAYNI